jgi:hypothetical protein
MKPIPLEGLVNLLAQVRGKKCTEASETSSADAEPRKSQILDITDEFVGKAFIITGAEPPGRPLTPTGGEELRNSVETERKIPPEK